MAPDFNITLPEGYSLSPLSDTECAIVREGETLGGLRLTDLGNNLKKVEDTLLYRYIDSLAPAPLIPEFMAMYCIVNITMRMLRVNELKRIMGFPEDYVLVGTQTEQKKFIGNAVEVNMARVLCEALVNRLVKLKMIAA